MLKMYVRLNRKDYWNGAEPFQYYLDDRFELTPCSLSASDIRQIKEMVEQVRGKKDIMPIGRGIFQFLEDRYYGMFCQPVELGDGILQGKVAKITEGNEMAMLFINSNATVTERIYVAAFLLYWVLTKGVSIEKGVFEYYRGNGNLEFNQKGSRFVSEFLLREKAFLKECRRHLLKEAKGMSEQEQIKAIENTSFKTLREFAYEVSAKYEVPVPLVIYRMQEYGIFEDAKYFIGELQKKDRRTG